MYDYIYPKPTRGVSSADAQTMINFSGVLQQRLLRVVQPASYSKALALCNLTLELSRAAVVAATRASVAYARGCCHEAASA